jgi:N-acetylglucosaminyldiphosphoundecaprenol N-acetyl-beta-D-mannosaminyltransferase
MSTRREHIRRRLSILDTCIDAISWEAILNRIGTWAARRESRYVCFCNVHSLVVGRRNAAFRSAIECADTAAPDGMPVAWLMRKRGVVLQERIDGPTLMWRYAEQAAIDDTPVFLYGATPETLDLLMHRLHHTFPGLRIIGAHSPPFRPLNYEEEDRIVELIVASHARVVFVGLGCPRQETWMARVSWRIPAVLIGVGAAFDFHAGVVRRAPFWMQRHGLEWLFRLATEPRRLWRRYCITNLLFLYYLLRDRRASRENTLVDSS